MVNRPVVIASPSSVQRKRLSEYVNRMPEFRVIARTGDLMNTYNEVEEKLPKAVLIADALAELPEFEVMRALFAALDVRWLVVTTPQRGTRFMGAAYRSMSRGSDLFEIPDSEPEKVFHQQLCALTRTPRQNVAPVKERLAGQARAQVQSPPMATPGGAASRNVHTVAPRVAPANMRARLQQPESPQKPVSHARQAVPARSPAVAICSNPTSRLILIGASTGGVDALLHVLSEFPEGCPPTLVVQHTGQGFGESLAGLLDRQCLPEVSLVRETTPLRPGQILIGAGIKAHLVVEHGTQLRATLKQDAPVAGHLPSVDSLFLSGLKAAPRITAGLLTGMGRDGADGMKALHLAGAHTIAQDEASCVVYGMPRAAVEARAVDRVLPLNQIGAALLKGPQGQARASSRREFEN